MEISILIVWVLLGILQIVMIVKFFQIASDVREVKSKMSVNTQIDSKKEFYKWIVAGELPSNENMKSEGEQNVPNDNQ